MSRFNTGNPLGSGDPRDLDDNAKNMDLAVNSDELRWSDRFGRDRKSFEGMEREFDSAQSYRENEFDSAQAYRENEFDSAQTYRESRFNDFIVSSGYQFLGDYAAGLEITEYNQLVRDENGEFWRLSGQVELPYTTTGSGVPEGDALVPAGDAVLRQDLADPDKGAAMVARAPVCVDSIADLARLPQGQRKEGVQYLVASYYGDWAVEYPYIGQRGGGEFYWDASRPKADNNGGTVIDPDRAAAWDGTPDDLTTLFSSAEAGVGCFVRAGEMGSVRLSWFGVVADGLRIENLACQAAIDHTPMGSVLDCSSISGTVLLDVPPAVEGNPRPAALVISRSLTMKGGKDCVFKIKDFCTAYEQWGIFYTDNRNVASVLKIRTSDVTVDGVVVDANGNFHYETAVNGTRWWDYGPSRKRTPDGIIVLPDEYGPTVKNVVVKNCEVLNPLAGISALGHAHALGMVAEFVDGTLNHSICENILFEGNTIRGARGNALLFNGGVRDSEMRLNKGINNKYHMTRFYHSVTDSVAHSNTSTNDYQEIADTYNNVDNGYWRTDDESDAVYYPIARSGFSIGPGDPVVLPGTPGSVRNCSVRDNNVTHLNPYAVMPGGSVEILSSSQGAAPLIISNSGDALIASNVLRGEYKSEVIRVFNLGVTGIGATVKNNSIKGIKGRSVSIQGDNVHILSNEFSIEGGVENMSLASVVGSGCYLLDNKITNHTEFNIYMATIGGSSGLVVIDGNSALSGAVSGTTGAGASRCVGSNARGGVQIVPTAPWIGESGTSYDKPLTLNILDHTTVEITGTIKGGGQIIYDVNTSLGSPFRPQGRRIVGSATVVVAGLETAVGDVFPLFHNGSGLILLVGYSGTDVVSLAVEMRWSLSGAADYSVIGALI